MSEPRKCGNCSAVVKTSGAQFCAFCGAELPVRPAPAPPSPHGDLAARFAALEAHPSFERAARRRPSTTGVGLQLSCGVAFGAGFALLAGIMAVMALSSGAPVLFVLAPLAFAAVGIGMAVLSAGKARDFERAPMRRTPALVVDERTEVSGGGENSSATTTYYVTLEVASGRRTEYAVAGKVAGRVAPGDMGVAFVKGSHLLDFDRISV